MIRINSDSVFTIGSLIAEKSNQFGSIDPAKSKLLSILSKLIRSMPAEEVETVKELGGFQIYMEHIDVEYHELVGQMNLDKLLMLVALLDHHSVHQSFLKV